jgi:hypothetical protein
MGPQQLSRICAERNSALGVSLGRLIDQGLAGDTHNAPGDQDLALVQVHVRPAKRAQFAAAGAKDNRQPQEKAQLGVLGQCNTE